MADLTITAANVQQTSTSVGQQFTAGEAIAEGEPFYVNDSNVAMLAQADTQAKAKARGIAVTAAALGDKVTGVTGGDLTIGATLTQNVTYGVSANSGKIAPLTDLVSDKWVTVLGVAKTTAILAMKIDAKGFQVP